MWNYFLHNKTHLLAKIALVKHLTQTPLVHFIICIICKEIFKIISNVLWIPGCLHAHNICFTLQ